MIKGLGKWHVSYAEYKIYSLCLFCHFNVSVSVYIFVEPPVIYVSLTVLLDLLVGYAFAARFTLCLISFYEANTP